MTAQRKQIYFNDPQRLTQLIGAHTTVCVAGRRTGKTDSIASPFVLRNMQRMPGSTGGIVVPTYKHGLTNTIPGLLTAFARWGYIRDVHYVIGKRPPKHFRKPIIDPVDYEHVMTFYNGSCAVIISQDRAGSSNSLTLSWVLVDEAKFIDYKKLKDETLPANGGIKTFGAHSFNHSLMILSDMPQTTKGSWFLHYREEMDDDVINAIKGLLYEIWRKKQHFKDFVKTCARSGEQLQREIKDLDRQLNQLRSVAVYYKEYSSIENVQLLGEAYIKQMKRDLTPLTFQTSILCKRIGIRKDGFYSNMTEKHYYDSSDFAYLDTYHWSGDKFVDDCRQDGDLSRSEPICIGMDYNANINWIVAGQIQGELLRVLKSFYVKYERKIPALITDFCNYYKYHLNKTVVYYYDSTAIGNNYAVDNKDFHNVVVAEFQKHGWKVLDIPLGNPMRHDEKYLLINEGFSGHNKLMPLFNRQNNDDLILALQTAEVRNGALGFKKFKGGEKLEESEENLLEHRTDGTDAFDTLYIGCEKYPQRTFDTVAFTGIS